MNLQIDAAKASMRPMRRAVAAGTMLQTTLRAPVSFRGRGLHSGVAARMTIRPASAEHGIWFRRTDVAADAAYVPGRWDAVIPSRLCTVVANAAGTQVSTIEHVMAALSGAGIHNALIEIDGPEVPVLDGSAEAFTSAFAARGLRRLDAPLRAFRVLEPVEVTVGRAAARLEPSDALEIDFAIDFPDAAIGRQHKHLVIAGDAFAEELADSRTFCREADVRAMRAGGLALGGTIENAVVVDGERVLTPGGFRRPDEAVRHKMLDAIGDLALAGAPILGRYTGVRAGHAVTSRLLTALFQRPDAVRLVACEASFAARLPGMGNVRAEVAA